MVYVIWKHDFATNIDHLNHIIMTTQIFFNPMEKLALVHWGMSLKSAYTRFSVKKKEYLLAISSFQQIRNMKLYPEN